MDRQAGPAGRAGRVAVAGAIRRYGWLCLGVVAFVAVVAFAPSVRGTRTEYVNAPFSTANFQPVKTPGQEVVGTTVGGYRCGPGIHQVPWSYYAPWCMTAWHGDNGGNTSTGVTASAITITARIAISGGDCTMLSALAPQAFSSVKEFKQVMNAYVALFNKDFDLYGRKVVVKYVNGSSCFADELLGQDVSEASADAAKADSFSPFADVSVVAATPPYEVDLAHDHIVSIGGLYMPHSFYKANAPYAFSPLPSCTKFVDGASRIVKRDLAGLPAIYAGSPGLKSKTRVFGVLYPDVTNILPCGRYFVSSLKADGINVAGSYEYAFDLSTLQNEASQIMTTFKKEGVTTVVCACDPLTPMYLADSAEQQDYHPEWLPLAINDTLTRIPIEMSTSLKAEFAHAVTIFDQSVRPEESEFAVAYKLATGKAIKSARAGTGTATSNAISVAIQAATIYPNLLLLFDGLQQAGPHLTPSTFERGIWSLPPSPQDAEYGGWSFGPGQYTAPANTQVVYWSPNIPGPITGQAGSWVACNRGAFFSYAGPLTNLPPGHQLQCYGIGGSGRPWVPSPSVIPKL